MVLKRAGLVCGLIKSDKRLPDTAAPNEEAAIETKRVLHK